MSAPEPRGIVHCADGVEVARGLADESVDLVYLDPPFNTGRRQERTELRTTRAEEGEGDRTGFGGRRYETVRLGSRSFDDGIPAVQPDEESRSIQAFDIAELLEVSVAPPRPAGEGAIPPGVTG